MKALKALVISMGLLVVAGLVLVGYGLYRNSHNPSGTASSAAGARAANGAVGYFSVDLPVPAGSKLEQMTTAGDRVILRFTGGEAERILVLDPQTGQVAGNITLVPQSR
ncbi:MAG TPA: hypothetical protein VK558_12815 [Patescibacteria group bacterium]|nr:hypothetical protein [Patescibacteria group bacterium]